MYFLYSLLLTLGVGALLPFFLLAAVRHGKYLVGLGERLGGLPVLKAGSHTVIWLHCVSVGETQAARPLAQAILARYPASTLVVSTTTLTGQRLAREVFRGEAAEVFFFPLDWGWAVRRSLNAIRPSLVLIMETELWPRFLRECRRRQIPVVLVNGRISEKSFRGYRRLGPFIRRVVGDLSLALMQTETDAERLRALGMPPQRVWVSGNVKFDADDTLGDQSLTAEFRERFASGGRRLIVAASTHAPEEAICLDAFKQLSRNAGEQRPRLLVAPRHPERFAEVGRALESSGLNWSRRSSPPGEGDREADLILLDSIGELRAVYPLADVVFVGGSIARTGGHNLLEPAAFAKCVITGAHTFNFTAAVRVLLEQDALIQLPDEDESRMPARLAHALDELLADDERRENIGRRARAALDLNRGATARSVELLATLFQDMAKVKGPQSSENLASNA